MKTVANLEKPSKDQMYHTVKPMSIYLKLWCLANAHIPKTMVFPIVTHGCELYYKSKARSWKFDAFEDAGENVEFCGLQD